MELTPPPALELNPPPALELTQAPPSVRKQLAGEKQPEPTGDVPTVFRCMNCLDGRNNPGRMFEADEPVCPDCGIDGRIPRFQHLICPVERIHFDPPHETIKRVSARCLACKPELTIPGPYRASGEILAVTCPECLLSDAGRTALGGRASPSVPPAADFEFRFTTPEK